MASIKPLALIAKEVAGDRARIDILLPVQASPHDYPLRVSDIRLLNAADLVLWIGPELETFLIKPLDNIAPNKRLTSYSLEGIFWPDNHVPNENHGHGHTDGHQHHGHDPHLWLDPRNAIVIARALAVRLGELDKEFMGTYRANAEKFVAEVEQLDEKLYKDLIPIRDQGFAVYHEGYLHFTQRYGLKQLAYVTYTPDRRPGAKHLYSLRRDLKGKALCLFTEPYYDMSTAKDLAEELDLKLGSLDPIGTDGVQSYHQLIESLASSFLACLSN